MTLFVLISSYRTRFVDRFWENYKKLSKHPVCMQLVFSTLLCFSLLSDTNTEMFLEHEANRVTWTSISETIAH